MFIRRFAFVCVTFVLVLSACSPQLSDCSAEEVFCVGLVTAYEGVENHGLNQAAWEVLQTYAKPAKIARLDNIESVDTRDWEKNLTFFANNNYDIIVTVGSNLAETTAAVATRYPAISFIGIDQQLEEIPANVATINFAREKAGFLAGIIAAMVSSSDKVGAVCETSGIDDVWLYCEAFRVGALYENKNVEVTVVYRENGDRDKTFNDPDWGRQSMLSLVDKGVDTMTAFGGNTAQGAFLAAAENRIFVIGSEEDLYYRLPEVQDFLVTSLVNDPGGPLSSLVLMASQGRMISGQQTGRVNYAPFRLDQFVRTSIQSNTENVFKQIESGEIKIDLPDEK